MRLSFAVTAVLAVLAGLLVGLGIYTFVYAKGYSYLTNNPQACTNCHVMRTQYDGWVKSSHRNAATCNDCHTPHNLIGKYAVKLNNGFWHSFYFTSGHYPDTIRITEFDEEVVEAACRRCHQNITTAIAASVTHAKGEEGFDCTRCHGEVGHSDAAYSMQVAVPLWSHHESHN